MPAIHRLADHFRDSDRNNKLIRDTSLRIGVVIPCFKVTRHVMGVIEAIGPEVEAIFAVDDCCPDRSGDFIAQRCSDTRVTVLRHDVNQGVGGAVITGYKAGLAAGMDVLVKVDGDGQMDPHLVPRFVAPIVSGEADYAKGNRFFSVTEVRRMPAIRLFGNACLSFATKLASGYWSIFDPTNGFTAVHRRALEGIDHRVLSKRYFFETDMLIRLGEVRAVVIDIPMRPVYADEVSGLSIRRIFGEFLWKHIHATFRRIVYSYFLRDFNVASLSLFFGLLFLVFGVTVGSVEWIASIRSGQPATTGTVFLAALPIIVGLQMLLFFLSYDTNSDPKRPIQHQAVLASLLPEWVDSANPGEGPERAGTKAKPG
jgi:dolichol-phosphate mannosyltransferase